MLDFKDIEQLVNGELLQHAQPSQVEHLVTDSRKTSSPVTSLFIAINGVHHDGHDFLNDLYERGLRQFIIERDIDLQKLPEASVIKVNSSLEALQLVAANHGANMQIPVVAITGSNGKTIVKEWLYQLMSQEHTIVKSPKSYNSQIGVPLSVWQMNSNDTLAIFEAGISQVDEMARLEPIIKPNVGIFTNIGTAHDQGFDNLEKKVYEKSLLFKNCDSVIYCMDHEIIHNRISEMGLGTFTWSKTADGANVLLSDVEAQVNCCILTIQYKDRSTEIKVPFTDSASIENAMHCITFMLYNGYELEIIAQRVLKLKGIHMRMELKTGVNNCQIIDDTYNNDLGGLQVALDFMSQQSTHDSKTVILSDILQYGSDESTLYQHVNALLKASKINKLIGVGAGLTEHKALFEMESTFFTSTDELLATADPSSFSEETILIKGARPFQLEKIVNRLVEKIHGTVLEINLNALTRNLNFYRSLINPDTKLMVMVKALTYGSGSHEVANLLQYHKVDYLGVAYVDEGVNLRGNGITLPIMVMNPSPESFDKLLQHNLEPEVYDHSILNQLILFLKGEKLGIHLKLDTGMRRLGFEPQHLSVLVNTLKANPNIEIKSIFTHLAGADEDAHSEFSHEQLSRFNQMTDLLKSELSISPVLHALNSAGILRFPEYHMDMVRLGIGLYGVETNDQSQNRLEPISRLKTVISQIKDIKKGETIGYGRKGEAKENMRIATLAIGYADGFNRAFGNGVGKVLINGQQAPVIGNVCMDMTMVDITNINTSVGDDAIIFDDHLTISEVADQINTIPYEILTNVSERVKRVFYLD